MTLEFKDQEEVLAKRIEPTRIEVDTKELKRALAALETLSSQRGRRTRLPILEGVYLACHADGILACRRTDLDAFAELRIPASILEPNRSNWKRIEGDPVRSEWVGPLGTVWQAVVSLRALQMAMKGASASCIVLELMPGTCTIVTGHGHTRLTTLPLEDYPTWPSDTSGGEGTLLGTSLTAAEMRRLGRTTFAAAPRDPARPVFECIHIEASNGTVEAACADSWRLAVQRTIPESGSTLDGFECLFSAQIFCAILKCLPKEGVVHWTLHNDSAMEAARGSTLRIQAPNFQVWIRLPMDRYPNYRAILTKQDRLVASFDRQMLLDAVSAAQAVAAESSNILSVIFARQADDSQHWYLTLNAHTDETAFEVTFPQPVDITLRQDVEDDVVRKGLFQVIVNCEYLRSGLAIMTGDAVTFRFTSETGMFDVFDSGNPGWSYHVQAMHRAR